QWLQEPTMWRSARQAAALITPQLIAQDTQFDLISGTSGTILGLLALLEVDPDPQILHQAMACGDHLLHHRVPGQTAGKAWATVDGQLLSGFSHGAAGIAYALLRLAQATGEERYWQAAQEAIDYETTLVKGDNWFDWQPDPASGQMPPVLTSWCHGAPGIGLGRLGGLESLATPSIRADIERALRTTREYPLEANDTLCCGNFGRLDFLLTLAKADQDSELEQLCRQQVTERVQRAKREQGYRLFPDLKGSLRNPGFLQGMAGIGYQLLRVADPDTFPSVLLWR
ncbi:MAG: lanthionine synthetase LanC family protein, partial [Thermostichus sp. BF3_bins_97]